VGLLFLVTIMGGGIQTDGEGGGGGESMEFGVEEGTPGLTKNRHRGRLSTATSDLKKRGRCREAKGLHRSPAPNFVARLQNKVLTQNTTVFQLHSLKNTKCCGTSVHRNRIPKIKTEQLSCTLICYGCGNCLVWSGGTDFLLTETVEKKKRLNKKILGSIVQITQ
jgi:hypothetical protein